METIGYHPPARIGHASTIMNKMIYYFGGYSYK